MRYYDNRVSRGYKLTAGENPSGIGHFPLKTSLSHFRRQRLSLSDGSVALGF